MQGKMFDFGQSEKIYMLSGTCFVIGLVLWINFQNISLSLLFGVVGFLFYLLCNIVLIYGTQKNTKQYLMGLLFACNFFGSLFFLKYFIQEQVYTQFGKKLFVASIGLVVFFYFLGAISVMFIRYFIKSLKRFVGVKSNRKVLMLIVFFSVLILINADVFDTWLRWDNYIYYIAYEKINFEALFSKSSVFRISSHPTYAMSLLVLVLNYIVEDANIVAYLLNFICFFGGCVCFMALVRKIFSNWSFVEVYLASFLYAASPFFLGGMKCLNLELYLTFSLLLYLMASAYNFRALQFIAGFMLVFGKETGVVMLFLIMIVDVLRKNIELRSLKIYLKSEDCFFALLMLILGVMWLIDYKKQNWLSTTLVSLETIDGSQFNNLDISWVYIKDKLKVLFLAQFNWFFWIAIIVYFCRIVVNVIRKKNYNDEYSTHKIGIWLEMLAAAIGCLAVNLFMITYNHMRYLSPLIPILYLMFLYAINKLFVTSLMKCFIYCTISAVMFVQCFFTIDPIMRHCFTNLKIGENSVLCAPPNNVIDFGYPFVGEIQYNRQIADFDDALDKIIASADYDDNSCIVISAEFRAKTAGTDSGYLEAVHCIIGCGYQYLKNPTRYMSWDDKNKKRYLANSSENEMNVLFITSADQILDYKQRYSKVIYIKMPWQDNLFENEIQEMNLQEIVVNHRGWGLSAYIY